MNEACASFLNGTFFFFQSGPPKNQSYYSWNILKFLFIGLQNCILSLGMLNFLATIFLGY